MLRFLKNLRFYILAKILVRDVESLGYVVADPVPLYHALGVSAELHEYVRRSGHLNTVSGRQPKAVKRVLRDTDVMFRALAVTPLIPSLGAEEEDHG